MLVRQLHHHGIRNTAIADLQRGTIGNHVGDVFADSLLNRTDLGQANLQDRLVALAKCGHLRNMDVTIAIGERNVRIHFQHDDASPIDRGHGVVGRQCQGKIPVLIHRRCHAEHHIRRHQATVEQLRHFREIGGNEINPAFLAARTRGTAVKIGGVADVIDRFRINITKLAHGENLRHLHISKIPPRVGQSR